MSAEVAYCERDGDRFAPTPLAQGPWGPTVNGNVIGVLLGRAAEIQAGHGDFQVARITVDLLRPARLDPLEVTASIQRAGKRIRFVEAMAIQDGIVIAKATVLFLRRGEQSSDPVWSAPMTMPPPPVVPPGLPDDIPMLVHPYGWRLPAASTSVIPSEWPDAVRGQKYAWLSYVKPLVAGEKTTACTFAAMAGDLTSAVAHWGLNGMSYINADYTVSLSRLPDGPQVGLASLTHYADRGVATGTAVLFDRYGPIGNGMATAIGNPGFSQPF